MKKLNKIRLHNHQIMSDSEMRNVFGGTGGVQLASCSTGFGHVNGPGLGEAQCLSYCEYTDNSGSIVGGSCTYSKQDGTGGDIFESCTCTDAPYVSPYPPTGAW